MWEEGAGEGKTDHRHVSNGLFTRLCFFLSIGRACPHFTIFTPCTSSPHVLFNKARHPPQWQQTGPKPAESATPGEKKPGTTPHTPAQENPHFPTRGNAQLTPTPIPAVTKTHSPPSSPPKEKARARNPHFPFCESVHAPRETTPPRPPPVLPEEKKANFDGRAPPRAPALPTLPTRVLPKVC